MLLLFLASNFALVYIVLGALKIPLVAFHEPKLRDSPGEYPPLSSTEEIQGASPEAFGWIKPGAKIQRLKKIELFAISENNIRLSPGPSTWSKITELLAKHVVILPRNDDLVHLTHTVPPHYGSLERLVKAIREVIKQFYTAVDLWDEGSPLDKTVLIAVEALQRETLTAPGRLWVLSVFRLLQSYLPRGDLKPIRLNPNTGPVCRGALELFLTEGIDLTHSIDGKKGVSPAIEALERVELIVKIKNHLGDFKEDNPTANFVDIYDTLLQTKGESMKQDFFWLSLRCMQHMGIEDTPRKEKEAVFHILYHISAFDGENRKHIQDHVAQNVHFGKIYQFMSNKLKYYYLDALRPRIKKYFSGEDVDPYIGNLLLPFLGLSPVSLEHIKHIITSLKYQQYALLHKQEDFYGLDPEKADKYIKDHCFVIDTLQIASPYIEGSKKFLDTEFEVHGKNLDSNLDLSLNLPMENSDPLSLPIEDKNRDPCPMCADKFFEGQRIIQLTCSSSHKLHAHCMDVLVSYPRSKCQDLLCPICRMSIDHPFSVSQHTIK